VFMVVGARGERGREGPGVGATLRAEGEMSLILESIIERDGE